MIKTKTKILVKDNSDLFKANCINYSRLSSTRRGAKIGHCVKTSISKLKSGYKEKLRFFGKEVGEKKSLQSLLIIQTKAPVYRGDGSTLQFNYNTGVKIVLKKTGLKKQHQLGFKRINTAVPFDLKDSTYVQEFKIIGSVIKLAKHLL